MAKQWDEEPGRMAPYHDKVNSLEYITNNQLPQIGFD
jgi:hypothetical protein